MSDGERPRADRRGGRAPLTRDDWLDAAAGLIVEGGFDALRILTLARRLGVSRGSFYWHFRDHQDLVRSFLERWRQRRVAELELLQPGDDDVEAETHRILRLLLGESGRSVRRMRVELAVRDFARRDDQAAGAVAAVDAARIRCNETLLLRRGAGEGVAHDRSLLLYVATMGAQLVMTGPVRNDATLERLERLIAGLALAPGQAGEDATHRAGPGGGAPSGGAGRGGGSGR